MARIYKENTNDNGVLTVCLASDNYAEYHITSAYGRDLVTLYEDRFNRHPSAAWFNRHFQFTRIK